MTGPQSHLVGVPSPTPQCVCLLLHSLRKYFLRTHLLQNLVASSPAQSPPQYRQRSRIPLPPQLLQTLLPPTYLPKASALSVPSVCGVLPCTSHDWLFPIRGNFLRRCLCGVVRGTDGLPRLPRLQTPPTPTGPGLVSLPPVSWCSLPLDILLGQERCFPGCQLLPTVDSEPGGRCHPSCPLLEPQPCHQHTAGAQYLSADPPLQARGKQQS